MFSWIGWWGIYRKPTATPRIVSRNHGFKIFPSTNLMNVLHENCDKFGSKSIFRYHTQHHPTCNPYATTNLTLTTGSGIFDHQGSDMASCPQTNNCNETYPMSDCQIIQKWTNFRELIKSLFFLVFLQKNLTFWWPKKPTVFPYFCVFPNPSIENLRYSDAQFWMVVALVPTALLAIQCLNPIIIHPLI